jgi:hypothetical protein
MYKKLLTKNFFNDNPYIENSIQQFTYSIILYEGIEDITSEIIREQRLLSDERLEQITRAKELINAEQNPEMVFQLLRKRINVVNRSVLVRKALQFEEVLIPMVIEKLLRSYHDVFIENSIQLLARSHNNYTSLLMEKYAEIRNPYVQSLICLILGFRGEEATIPWMLDKFFEMKKKYPNETYDQGPLLALHELNSRFYKK